MPEIIDLGSLKLRFLQTKDDTAGNIDMFEMTLQPNARMPIPHYHDRWDETIYGLDGTTTWRVAGISIWRPARPSSSNAASYTALPTGRQDLRHASAPSFRGYLARNTSGISQACSRPARPIPPR